MADSSFDPLAMVKAMGPQRDPYSWAELYAKDAATGRLHQEDMRNRLLIQEMIRAERAKEGEQDRLSREGIARGHDAAAMERLKKSVELGLRGVSGRGASYDFPGEKQPLTEKQWRRKMREPDAKDYRGVQIGGKMIYYHKDNPPVPRFANPATAPATAPAAINPANPAARTSIPIEDPDDY